MLPSRLLDILPALSSFVHLRIHRQSPPITTSANAPIPAITKTFVELEFPVELGETCVPPNVPLARFHGTTAGEGDMAIDGEGPSAMTGE